MRAGLVLPLTLLLLGVWTALGLGWDGDKPWRKKGGWRWKEDRSRK